MSRTPLLVAALCLAVGPALAATPESGTINDGTHQLEFGGGPFVIPNSSPDAGDEPVCQEGLPICDEFRFEVNLSKADPNDDEITIEVGWPTADADFDIYLYDDATGNLITSSVNGGVNPEVMFTPAANGKYRVVVVPYLPLGDSYTGKVRFIDYKSASSGIFGGALGAGALLVAALAAGLRRRIRH